MGRTGPPIRRGLTAREDLFIRAFLSHPSPKVRGNAAAAAQLSGYSADKAAVRGMTMLRSPRVRAEIARRLDRADLKADRVLREIEAVAFADPTDAVQWTNGAITVQDSKDLPRDVTAAIAEISQNPLGGVRLRFHNKIEALKLLASYWGLTRDAPGLPEVVKALLEVRQQNLVVAQPGSTVNLQALSDEDLDRLEAILAQAAGESGNGDGPPLAFGG